MERRACASVLGCGRETEEGLELAYAGLERIVLRLEFLQPRLLARPTLARRERVLETLALDGGDDVGWEVLVFGREGRRSLTCFFEGGSLSPAALGECAFRAGRLALARRGGREDRRAVLDRGVEREGVDGPEPGRDALR